MMNLYSTMKAVGGEKVTPKALIDTFRASRGAPNFMGHPSTCDGKQIADLPALCAPQQVIAVRRNGRLVGATGWIDIPAIVR